MKKKILALILVMAMCISCLAGCNSNEEEPTKKPKATGGAENAPTQIEKDPETTTTPEVSPEVTPETTPEVTPETTPEVTPEATKAPEAEAFDVTLTLSPSIFGDEDITQEQLDASVIEKGYKSATLNSDGTVTYVMTKSQHKTLMDGYAKIIDDTLKEAVAAGAYSDIKKIEHNSDFTKYTLTTTCTNSDDLDDGDAFLFMGLAIYSACYWQVAGIEEATLIYELKDQMGNVYDTLDTSETDVEKPGIDTSTEAQYTMPETTLIDNEFCTVKYLRTTVEYGMVQMHFYLENKTDKQLNFVSDNEILNGYNTSSVMYQDVAAGMSTDTKVYFGALEDIGSTVVEQYIFDLEVSEAGNYKDAPMVEQKLAIYPTGKSASEIVPPARKTTATEKVLVDNDTVNVVILSYTKDDFWGHVFEFYIENKTDKNIYVKTDEFLINGADNDPYWGTEIGPKAKAYTRMFLDDKELATVTIEKIEFLLIVKDWSSEDRDQIFELNCSYEVK